MGGSDHRCCEIILKMVAGDPRELLQLDPLVVSCGGMYIPHKGKRTSFSYHILTTPNDAEPVKVVAGGRPLSILQKVMAKESMN